MDAIIMAAGAGTRMKAGKNKVLLPLCGKPVLLYAVEAFEKSEHIDNIIVVTGESDIDECKTVLSDCKKVTMIIPGGNTRQESSYIGVSASDAEFVLIHDGARALITTEDVDAVAEGVFEHGAAVVGTRCVDTMKICADNKVMSTVDRANLVKIYTPQGFRRSRIVHLHKLAKEQNVSVTDDCMLLELAGESIFLVEGNPLNIKLTTPEDICIAEAVLKQRNM